MTTILATLTRPEHGRAAIEAAFSDALIYLQVDPEISVDPYRFGSFEGWKEFGPTKLRLVHVISRPARGEIRGYVAIAGETRLRLRLPCYSGAWPEMDEAVASRVFAAGGAA